MIGQVWIAVFGVAAIWLSMSPNQKTARWGCVFGLLGQPGWFYETWIAGQWGIFALSFLYLLSWIRGIKTHWLDRRSA
ncbi:hypothetical protein [Zhongshania sp.]|uniref:hypothetical protein n=1 Tax=Zhongshania sp. TaxID=1971902 RepID=UPI0035686F20